MRRYAALLLAVVLLAAAAAGCAGKSVDVDVKQLATQLATDVSYGEPLTELEPEAVERAFRVDPADVAAVDAYIGSGATVDEVSVWEATDDAAAEKIEKTLQERVDQRKTDYADYKPEEVPKLDKAILTRVGKYVVLCVTDDDATAQNVINSALQS